MNQDLKTSQATEKQVHNNYHSPIKKGFISPLGIFKQTN